MSVLKAKRGNGEIKFNVIINYKDMRSVITDLTFRNFTHTFLKDMFTSEKAEKFVKDALKKDGFDPAIIGDDAYNKKFVKRLGELHQKIEYEDAVALEFIKYERSMVLSILREMGSNIIMANSIFPYSVEESMDKIIYQNRSVGNCYQLKNELNQILESKNLRLDRDKFIQYDDIIEKQISLLKGWKTRANKRQENLENLRDFEKSIVNIKYEKQTQVMMLDMFMQLAEHLNIDENNKENDRDTEWIKKCVAETQEMIKQDWMTLEDYYKEVKHTIFKYKLKTRKDKDKDKDKDVEVKDDKNKDKAEKINNSDNDNDSNN